MTTALRLAGAEDMARLLPMVSAFQAEEGVTKTEAQLRAALEPLLHGSPHGAVWLIGPARAPVGYIIVCFGWSVEFGGLDGFIDEFWIRPAVRGRGMGSEVLAALIPTLAEAGMKGLHLEVQDDKTGAQALYARHGFRLRKGYRLMSWQADAPGPTLAP